MRKAIVILALTVTTVMASAGDAFAQRRGVYRGGGWGNSFGIGRGYYSPYNTYGSRYNSTPYNYGSNYYYVDPIVQIPSTEIQQSFYPAPVVQQSANVVVVLPRADAQVWFDGAATSQSGMERTYTSPPLEPGTYVYSIRARWMENGKSVQRERRVNVQRGESVTVDFRNDLGEGLQIAPRSK
jgi:uncharacterized protein (TIGR03000 family)